MAKEIVTTVDKIKRRKKRNKIFKIIIVAILLPLMLIFAALSLIYSGGKFTISLDQKFAESSGIVLYNDSVSKKATRKLYANNIDYMDNISVNWIPQNIDTEKEGAHNGDNYIAYTFFIENQGEIDLHYWYTLYIDDVIKNVDEAIRIMIFRNGEKTIYAKTNPDTNKAEENTKEFYSDSIAVLEKVEQLKVGDVDKYTIVVWLEGDDPNCLNNLIGGEIKLHMEITEEHFEGGRNE